MQCAPPTPSPAANARSKACARSLSDRVRNGRWAGLASCAAISAECRVLSPPPRSLEQAHDALVLLDVPAVLVVVSGNRHRARRRALRFPDARALHRRVAELCQRAAQLVELHVHLVEPPIELGDVARPAVVSG